MIVNKVREKQEKVYDVEIDEDMRKLMMSELVKKAMNALSRSFDNNDDYVYEALECLQSWANIKRPSKDRKENSE